MDFEIINHKELASDVKNHYKKIMCEGNEVFIKWHKKVKEAYTAKTGKKHFSRNKLRGVLFKTVKKHGVRDICVLNVPIKKEEIEKILEIKKIEESMLKGYGKFIYKMAYSWSNKGTNIEFNDAYQEVQMQFINSMYGFTRPEMQFSTFVHYSIVRHMINLCKENKQFGGWTPVVNDLYNEFEYVKKRLNRVSTKDEVCHYMNKLRKRKGENLLSEKELKLLNNIFTNVISQTDIEKEDGKSKSINFDELLVDNSYKDTNDEKLKISELEMKAIKTAGLTNLEKEVLKCYLKSDITKSKNGWATKFAANNINPNTGKNYSKAAPGVILKKAKEKILNRYKEINLEKSKKENDWS